MTHSPQADDSMNPKCLECGAAITPTAKFCPECGAIQTSRPVDAAAPSVPSEEHSVNSDATKLTSGNESLHQTSQPRSLASHRRLWLGIAVVVFALVSVGSWAWVARHPITAKAQYDLGVKCEKGDGIPKDYAQAARSEEHTSELQSP